MQNTTKWSHWVLAAAIPFTASLHAVDFYGLTQSGDRLIKFHESGAVSGGVSITGLQALDSLQDIDKFFSGDGRLFGIGSSSTLYTIDPNTGVATVNVPNAAVGSPTAIDFNPMADRLRILSGDANYRLTPNTGVVTSDGTVAFVAGDPNAGVDPTLVAAAYINNVDAPPSTALYSIDTGLNALILHSGPAAFSMLNTVGGLTLGGLPFNIGSAVGFDIYSAAVGNNAAFVSNGNDLYSLNLATGALSPLGTVGTTESLRSIAVAGVPEGGSMVSGLALAMAGLAFFRARHEQVAVR